MWNWPERRFLGFRTVTATLPCIAGESQCPKKVFTFLQSKAAFSPPEKIEEKDGITVTVHFIDAPQSGT